MARKHKRESPCSKGESYIMICGKMFASDAYRDLNPTARALLNEFLMIHRPERNGYLAISTREAERLLKVGQSAATSAFHSLEAHGFIKLSMDYSFRQGLTREWRLTFREAYEKKPTHEWRRWDRENPYPVTKKSSAKIKSLTPQINTPCVDSGYTCGQNAVRKMARIE